MSGQSLERMAQATSWDEATLSARVVLSTDSDIGDGTVLVHTRAAIQWPERPVPVVLDHRREIGAVIGAITDMALEPLNNGVALVGRLVLDGPAAGQALPLLRTGAARWSIGARILRTARVVGSEVVKATSWHPSHLALVVEPADTAAITRSSNPIAPANMTSTIGNSTSPENLERTAKEVKRERDILKIAQAAGVTDEATIDRWVSSDLSTNEVSREAVRLLRLALEGGDVRAEDGPAPLGHPARMHATPATRRDLQGILAAKMNIKGNDVDRSLAGIPMHMVLRDHLANDPESRGYDLAAMPLTKLVNRAFSTSDFSKALEATTERVLLSAYQEAQSGVLTLATSRDLPDFRAMEMIRVSQYGEISEKLQGGEYKTAKFSEENVSSLQAAEYGAIQPLTRRALANDSLGIFAEMMAEMGRACARKERSELAKRLLTGFTWTAKNSDTTTGALAMDFINGVIAGTLKLRRQTDLDGNPVSFEPRLLLVAPEQEAIARMALGEYVPNNGDDVMPFRTLRVEVDHYLPGGSFYLCDTAYPQLVIGRIGNGPVITESEEFVSGSRLYRCQSDFGTAVLDQRSIVKLTITT